VREVSEAPDSPIGLVTYVLIARAAELTGYSKRAIVEKIAKGVWREGLEWRKAPDGHRMIDLKGVMRWVETGKR
jgi:hypothetical protein